MQRIDRRNGAARVWQGCLFMVIAGCGDAAGGLGDGGLPALDSGGAGRGPDDITLPVDGSLQGSRPRDAAAEVDAGGDAEASDDAAAQPEPQDLVPMFETVDVVADLAAAAGGLGRGGVAVYDWDKDGVCDLLGFTKGGPNGTAVLDDSISWQRGLGEGAFGPVQILVTLGAVGIMEPGQMTTFGPIDLERDGDSDLVANLQTSYDSATSRDLYLIHETGQFTAIEGYPNPNTQFRNVVGIDPFHLEDGSIVDSVAISVNTMYGKSVGSFVAGLPGETSEQLVGMSSASTDNRSESWNSHRVSRFQSGNGAPFGTSASFVVGEYGVYGLEYEHLGGFDGVTGRFAHEEGQAGFGFATCNGNLMRLAHGSPTDERREPLPPDAYAPYLTAWDGDVHGGCSSITAGDVDGDGLDDLIVLSTGTDRVWVMRALGGHEFAPPADIGSAADAIDPYLEARDVDGDGDLDLFETPADMSGRVRIFLNGRL